MTKKTSKNQQKQIENKPRKFKQYFIVLNDELRTIKYEFFDDISLRMDALSLGAAAYRELYKTLKEEAEIDGDSIYVGPMKVVTGLERTLNELDFRFPFLREEIRSLIKTNKRIINC